MDVTNAFGAEKTGNLINLNDKKFQEPSTQSPNQRSEIGRLEYRKSILFSDGQVSVGVEAARALQDLEPDRSANQDVVSEPTDKVEEADGGQTEARTAPRAAAPGALLRGGGDGTVPGTPTPAHATASNATSTASPLYPPGISSAPASTAAAAK